MWRLGSLARHPAVSLRNAWPPVVRDMRARRRVLASYAWEETAFPAAFAEEFNLTLDLITVVSRQTAQFLRDAGVSTPMAVVGNGVDHLLDIVPEPLPRPLPDARFRFLHISSCFPRKGVDILLKAYGEAFRATDDVALVIKTFPNPHNDVAAQIERCQRSDPYYPRIELIEEDWTPGQIASLYRSCHALVAPSRGEGFGLPIAEATLYRLPVIVTGWGGHMDFCSDETCWLIDYTPQFAQTHLSQTGSLWAEPDAAHLAALMRSLPALPENERAARAERARERVLANYTWRQVAARTRAALAALDARPGLPPPPRIGWMSTWGSRCGIAAYSQHMVGAFSADPLHIFAPAGEETTQDDAPNVHRNWALGTTNLDRLIADARRLALDALVIQFHWGFFPPGTLAHLLREMRVAGVRVVVDFHNTRSAPPAARDPEVTQALAGAERLLVHTLDDMQRLAAFGLAANLTLFPLAAYPVARPADDSVDATRRRLGLGRRRVIASYGFLLPHKGLAQLVEAMPALLAAQPDLHLLMVNALYSPERSGAEHRHLRERIVDLGLGDRITLLTDFLPEAECVTLLKTAELVVFPYQNTEES
jgi:glycosyltransferase involved in cell wall biosynthesis